MTSLLVSTAELAGTIVYSTLFGCYCVLFVGSLYVFLSKREGVHRPVNKYLLAVDIALFLLIVVHWIIQVDRLFDAFIYRANDPGGPEAYYEAADELKWVVKTAFYIAQTSVGDITMIYRLYIVWGGNWRIIIVPTITTAALTIAGINAVISFARQPPGVDIFTSASGHWVITVFATTLFTNVFVTFCISYRIWSVSRLLDKDRRRSIRPVIQIVVESALIYTVCLLVAHVAYIAKAPFSYIALDATSPAIGIAFTLIIVRVGLGRGAEQYTTAYPTRPPVAAGSQRRKREYVRSHIRFARSIGTGTEATGTPGARHSQEYKDSTL